MSDVTPTNPLAAVRALRLRADELSKRLESESTQLLRKGRLADPSVLRDVQALDAQVRGLMSSLADGLETTQDATLGDCERILEERQRRSAASALVDRVLMIESLAGEALPGLDVCQSAARLFRDRLASRQFKADDEALIDSLLRDQHAWCALVTLVDQHDSLAADTWNRLQASVACECGADVAAAAARGKLKSADRKPGDVWNRLARAESLVSDALREASPPPAQEPSIDRRTIPVRLPASSPRQPVAAAPQTAPTKAQPLVPRSTSRRPSRVADAGAPTMRALVNRRLAYAAGLILAGVALVATLSLGLKAGVDTHFRWRADATRSPAPTIDIN